ncbi:MAG: tripartite tricarboxylate transporter substrate binding protein [Reyranella sp.]|jgi:tripartite-type tricarboxylate transporter receptor subunit TctC|nr:tripartite tricarboxylate transporter substrate binding protein [Reyranella sp.]
MAIGMARAMIGRRRVAGLLGASLLPRPARADDFPDKPITLVVPFAAGGAIDVLARLASQQAGAALGEPFVIDNRGGAAGLIGAASVAKAAPDGYTLLMASAAQVTIPPWINRSLAFDPPKDLVPVAHLADTPMVLIVSANSELRSVEDFIAKARANRGGMNYASTGVGTISNLVMESLKLAADIDVVHVPYRGAAPALNDLQGGQVQSMFTSTASAAPLVAAGKLRPLAVTTANRSPLMPDVPTMAEAGWPAAEVVVWAGVMAPAGTPRTIVRQLERAFIASVQAPDVRERMIKLGADPVGIGAKAFAEVLEKDLALWQRVAQASGVKVE